MKEKILAILAALVVVASFTAPALANNVHIKRGPSFTDNGLTLTASGSLAGLGNTDILVILSATANPTATCSNPSGANKPPGQNPAPVTVTGSESIPASAIKNGNVAFSVTTNPPSPNPIPGAPDCPGSSWTETITDMSFTSATITVQQPVGTVVLVDTCTFSPSTANGAVPASSVTCKVT
ncbi:MAG TPA: hypothetical protein VIO11_02455 [Candidatus Methanoperedens sp.]